VVQHTNILNVRLKVALWPWGWLSL